jgi:hypothetical protein
MYLLLKIVVDDLDKQRRTFFWKGGSEKEIPPGQVASDMPNQ